MDSTNEPKNEGESKRNFSKRRPDFTGVITIVGDQIRIALWAHQGKSVKDGIEQDE
jgi:hypothetical protein